MVMGGFLPIESGSFLEKVGDSWTRRMETIWIFPNSLLTFHKSGNRN
jgi:hypothetical protein